MKNIILLNGSPRTDGSTSKKLLHLLQERFSSDCNVAMIDAALSLTGNHSSQDYASMKKADAIIIAFPLYVYCLPGVLTEFLSGYSDYLKSEELSGKPDVYALINCGFPESRICEDAALVINRFCLEIHAAYRFSILIGSGGMLQPMQKMPFISSIWKHIYQAFDHIVSDISNHDAKTDIHIDSKMPKKLFYFIAQTSFSFTAKASGLTKEQLYRKPYLRT